MTDLNPRDLREALDLAEQDQQARHRRDRRRMQQAVDGHRRRLNFLLGGGASCLAATLALGAGSLWLLALPATLGTGVTIFLLMTVRFQPPGLLPAPRLKDFIRQASRRRAAR